MGSLDMEQCGFERYSPRERGASQRRPARPSQVLSLRILQPDRSSRMLERACQINLEAICLMRRLRPDHKTIDGFRRRNPKAFKGLVVIDGTQLKAVNNPRKNLTLSRLKRMIGEADERIEQYLKRLDDEDAREKGGRKLDRRKLRSKIELIERARDDGRRQA